jgi:hypothetical protein
MTSVSVCVRKFPPHRTSELVGLASKHGVIAFVIVCGVDLPNASSPALGSKARPICTRGHLQFGQETPPHDFDATETAGTRHLLQIAIAFFELATRSFHSQMCNELRRGRADFPRKNTREIPRTHCDSIRELLDPQVITKMLGDPGLEIAENLPF